MSKQWDLIVIGSGPAGMCAAIEASRHGSSVLVLDRQVEPGGQIFRAVGGNSEVKNHALGRDYARGAVLLRDFNASGAVFNGSSNVWHLTPGRVYASHPEGSIAHLARRILVATGGMERPVPLPGWTLPGVMGAGAADVLLKSASLYPQGPVILCGNGPLILQSAVHLKQLNIPIAGVALTGGIGNYLKSGLFLPGALTRPIYLAQGMYMALRTLLGACCHQGSTNLSITGKDGDFTLSFTSLGKQRALSGGTVLLHEGVISESRITRLARLRHAWSPIQRYWHAQSDHWGNTNLEGVYVAGDCAGVMGADAAMARGRLAALEICWSLGRLDAKKQSALAWPSLQKFWRCRSMQPYMDALFAPSPAALQPADETTVCRCEELSAGELRKIIATGCYSPDGLKAQARPGMGACQGRMCAPAVAEMIAHTHGIPLDNLPPYHAQPPLFPLRLGELADMSMPPEG